MHIQSNPPTLDEDVVQVWRVRIGRDALRERHWRTLSPDEQARANRFHFARDRDAFVIAHSALRDLLGRETALPPDTLRFVLSATGKPSLPADQNERGVHFNLSHSGEVALVAVARGPVGVDIERWNDQPDFLALADEFFSPRERVALRALAKEPTALKRGFFQAWSRKEAYLKATGAGISQGLHHFDVSLHPDAPPALLGDRLDASAVSRWHITDIDAGSGYSAALVSERALRFSGLFEYA